MASGTTSGQSEIEKSNLQIMGRPQTIMADLAPEGQGFRNACAVRGDQVVDGHQSAGAVEVS